MLSARLAIVSAVTLFIGALVLVELGRRVGQRFARRDPSGLGRGVGAVEAGVFALLGLLISLSFFGAAGRFDERRKLIVEEANAIGTAYLRVDALPVERRAAIREGFKQYLDRRLETYRLLPDLRAARAEHAHSVAVQRSIWRQAVVACQGPGAHASSCLLVLPALNAMIDLENSRTMTAALHPPAITFVLLFGVALASAFIGGYSTAASRMRRWLHALAFAFIVSSTFYVILDLEYPRMGFIRETGFDRALLQLRSMM